MTRRVRLKEKYYYCSLTYASMVNEKRLMEERISRLSVKVEYSLAPSGCPCYRILRADCTPGCGLPRTRIDEWNLIPYALPGGQAGLTTKQAVRELSPTNSLACLYKEWQEVPRVGHRVRAKPTGDSGVQRRTRRVRRI